MGRFRFIFDEPAFLKRMNQSKESREFMLPRKAREAAIGGSGLELTLRNNLTQRVLASEAGTWIRSHARFKSICNAGQLHMDSIFHVENPVGEPYCFFGPGANFDLEGLDYEWRPDVFTLSELLLTGVPDLRLLLVR